jgi:hypothetical protein
MTASGRPEPTDGAYLATRLSHSSLVIQSDFPEIKNRIHPPWLA